jgi:hypothetical protein
MDNQLERKKGLRGREEDKERKKAEKVCMLRIYIKYT